jgi:hypothetical protein
VANQPKTPARTFRIPEPLWERVAAEAERDQVTATAVLVRALEEHFTD